MSEAIGNAEGHAAGADKDTTSGSHVVTFSSANHYTFLTQWSAELKAKYEQDRDSQYVWFAYRLCRTVKVPVWDWVLESFDSMSRAVERLEPGNQGHKDWQTKVVRALGFYHTHDPVGPRGKQATDRQLLLAIRYRLIREDGRFNPSKDALRKKVAELSGVDEKTVQRAWAVFGEMVEQIKIDDHRVDHADWLTTLDTNP